LKYLSETNPKAKAQLLVLLQAQGISVSSPPPADLLPRFHVAWDQLSEEWRLLITKEWAAQPYHPERVKILLEKVQ